MTVVYLMRHSSGDKNIDFTRIKDNFENQNRKYELSIEGEKTAYLYSKLKELNKLNQVLSSNYARSISTAKYVATKNKKDIIVDSAFDERKFGVQKQEMIPADFFKKQMLNHDYKLKGGESFNEVKVRGLKGLSRVLKENYGKKALIVTHASTICAILSKWCDINYDSKYIIKYKDKKVVDNFSTPDLLELKFDEKNKLVSLKRITVKTKD